jgi:hypothetical protein
MDITRIFLIAAALSLVATPAFAQFPPPGIYACVDGNGAAVGTLTLLVAGDYSFTRPDGTMGNGQVASASTDVNPLSGPLKDMGATGSFALDQNGEATFRFTAAGGAFTCALPPA